MEVTETQQKNDLAPNLNLDISKAKQDYYLAVEIKRMPFDGVLKPLNMLQLMIWDDIIYNFILKTSSSIKQSWKDMPKERRKELHHRFAIKYGSKSEMEEFRNKLYNMSVTKDIIDSTKTTISKVFRRLPPSKRKKINHINSQELSSFDKFVFKLSQFGIILILPIEEDK